MSVPIISELEITNASTVIAAVSFIKLYYFCKRLRAFALLEQFNHG
jgi:hypothetical protein